MSRPIGVFNEILWVDLVCVIYDKHHRINLSVHCRIVRYPAVFLRCHVGVSVRLTVVTSQAATVIHVTLAPVVWLGVAVGVMRVHSDVRTLAIIRGCKENSTGYLLLRNRHLLL